MSLLYQNRELTATQADSSGTCARCNAIPWDSLASTSIPKGKHGVDLIKIPESHDQLLNSSCSICRLLATIQPQDHLRWPRFEKPKTNRERHDPRNEECVLTLFSAAIFLIGSDAGGNRLGNVTMSETGLVLAMTFGRDKEPTANWYAASECIGLAHTNSQATLGIQQVYPSSANFDMIRDCISVCQETHGEACNSNSVVPIPGFRVIDCNQPAPNVIRVSNTVDYVALSYVWGQSNWDESGLPPIILDAIAATLKMGFQYLWVDRYCIDQDDSNDRREQIARMGDIYADAIITIVAASSNETDYRLPGIRSTRHISQQQLHVGTNTCLLQGFRHPSFMLKDSPYATRGWTFQESLLSRRRVIFSDDQVSFLCNTAHWAESWSRPSVHIASPDNFWWTGFVPLPTSESQRSRKCYVAAVHIVVEYSRRTLKYESDALNACLGIIQRLGRDTVFSPWATPMVEGSIMLDWKCAQKPPRRRSGFPSWSILGWQGPISIGPGWWDAEQLPIAIGTRAEPKIHCPVEDHNIELDIARLWELQALHITGRLLDLPIMTKTFTESEMSELTVLNLSHNGHAASAIIPKPRGGIFAKVCLTSDVNIFIAVNLDVQQLPVNVRGMLLNQHTSIWEMSRSAQLSLLLVQLKGGIYERVDLLRYNLYSVIRPWSPQSITPEIFFTDSSGALLDEVDWPLGVGEAPFSVRQAGIHTIVLG